MRLVRSPLKIVLAGAVAVLVLSCAEEDHLSTDSDYTQIATGLWHSCGLRGDGTVVCWGCSTDEEAVEDHGQCSARGYLRRGPCRRLAQLRPDRDRRCDVLG